MVPIFSEKKERIEYLDALRGFTMLLVVYSHVVTFTIGHDTSVPNRVFLAFRMPLFFFLSGFLSYAVYTPQLMRKRLKNRLLQQLLPTVVVFLLYVWCYRYYLNYAVAQEGKLGYWFTYVMVEIFCCYLLLTLVCRLARLRGAWETAFYAVVALGSYLVFLLVQGQEIRVGKAWHIASLSYFFHYLPYFIAGTLAKRYFPQFLRLISNGWVMSGAIVAFAFFLYYPLPGWKFVWLGICGLLGIMIVYRVFEYYKDALSSRTRLGRFLALIGRNTLAVYLFHYFIVRGLRAANPLFHWDLVQRYWLVELAVILALSIAITLLCILVSRLLRVAPPLRALLLGIEPRKRARKCEV